MLRDFAVGRTTAGCLVRVFAEQANKLRYNRRETAALPKKTPTQTTILSTRMKHRLEFHAFPQMKRR